MPAQIPDIFLTIGDVIKALDYLYDLPRDLQPMAADEIMKNMEASPDGIFNLGYMIGYYPKKKRRELYKILGIDHPFLGTE